MATFPDFQKAQFGDVAFPYTQISIKGGLRHHVHEFPHAAGGQVEKLGRKVYTFRFRVPFHDVPGSNLERDFGKNLYPNVLRNLLSLFDRGVTLPLVLPNLGTMQCACTDWDGVAEMSEALSGESWNLEFVEDQEVESVVKAIPAYGIAAMKAASDDLWAKAKKAYNAQQPHSLFQAINDAVAAVDGVVGIGDQYSRLAASKLEAVANLCGRADREIDALQDPKNHPLVEALKDVWINAVDLAENRPGGTNTVSLFRVPALMSIGQVSTTLFGTSERGMEILSMNAIEDAFAIPAGTAISYMKDAA